MPSSTTPLEAEEREVLVLLKLTSEQAIALKVAAARREIPMRELVNQIVLEKLPALSGTDLT